MTKYIFNLFILIFRMSSRGLLTFKLSNYKSLIHAGYIYTYALLTPTNVAYSFDAPLPWQMNFQQSASPTMEGIVDLHHNIMIFMVYIVIFISYILIRAIMLFNSNIKGPLAPISRTRHHLSLEIIWTILPLLILFWIALPSFALLYSIDHCPKIDLTIKVIGRQWYWTYEIDTFVKYKVKKPTHLDLKETSFLYELMAELAKRLVEADLGNVKEVSPLACERGSTTDIFLSTLSRLVNSNFKVTDETIEKLNFSYLSCFNNVRAESAWDDSSILSPNSEWKGDNFIITNKIISTNLSDSNCEDIWKQFESYETVPKPSDISLYECNPENNVLKYNTNTVSEHSESTTNDETKKKINYCPNRVIRENALTSGPLAHASIPYSWILDNLIENFDEVFSEKHHTRFSLLENIDFFKAFTHTIYDISLSDPHAYYGYMFVDPIDHIMYRNNIDFIGWFYIKNFIHPLLYLKNKSNLDYIINYFDSKYFVPVTAEYFYFNEGAYIFGDLARIRSLKDIASFNGVDLLKDFFSAFVTGDLYDFQLKLNKRGLTLHQFLENFTNWYSAIYDRKWSRAVSSKYFSQFLIDLAGDNYEWIKANGISFVNRPSVFGINYQKYYDWAADLLGKEAQISIEDMLNKIDKSTFGIYGKLDKNETHEVLNAECALIKKNERLAESLMNDASLKTYVFFHSLFENEIFDTQKKLKNKFHHYLVEFDSCIVSDNEVYNNYLNISKNEDCLNLENLPTSFCGWWRLLEVDNRLVLPIKTRLRVLVTSSDVLHSWAVPSLGVKIDACPGRLNCVYVYIKRPGVFHGQCSELCGVKHGFMPIVVHGVTRDKYNRWFADTCELVN